MIPDENPLYSYTHQLRSRYGETDQMGYVYYGRYLEYFEEARTEMIRSLGFPYKKLEDQGVMLPVVHTQVAYKAPVFYDELMHIEVALYDIPVVKMETFYSVYTKRRQDPHILGEVTLCFMNEKNRKPCKAPDDFIENLKNSVR